MTRTKRDIHALFRAIHDSRNIPPLPAAWRWGVMDQVLRNTGPEDPLSRMAPRFTLAAMALSAIGLAAGSWSIHKLAVDMGSAYASMLLDLTSSAWALL
ncbi:hypothetical protein [Pseudodesulfovibrio portus]|nr:hypothetical protein [Pseudodesulfovibrio portus]